MARCGPPLVAALRRAVPFFTRRGIHPQPGAPEVMSSRELAAELAPPCYVVELAADPGGARAALCLDAGAIAFVLEGTLGGDGRRLPHLDPQGLTAAQRAFVARISDSIVAELSAALARALGVRLRRMPDRQGEKTVDGAMVAMSLELADGDSIGAPPLGRIVIALSKHVLTGLAARGATERPARIDERVVRTLEETEVELVAELGRLKLSISDVSQLAVGTTLRLDVPVKGEIDVRVGDCALFRGQPTARGSQLAIRIGSGDRVKSSDPAVV
jgi:flagellar motor switch protein FliM